ncbi:MULTISPECIES: helix-turn-helix domain-containing protein [unclassified Neorhizobium]|uniref:helix-turn-helix domain-containing protein n=1 Tax=unclassified Neorhizobium TaxID=2629175 RepID=UPI001FF2B247|nr:MULTISPECIES: helix-turn-helix domain-containing protein [unclassified Neorhizobium]MCJ9672910.1 helix-turn-helix domain-containing protein [Neorhizobium sp. SHOUNA12B]MCJ9748549.1 helix-turn-helix domain-containing protein [Neorhizobium sp. SHOUNA12A]
MQDKPDLPSKTDFATAWKALTLVRGLSGDAKTVAGVILSHFNAKTGQCDPGTERLMAKAGVSKRTVVNATNELDRRGLVVKVRHGGNGFRSRYQPNWTALRQIVDDFESDEPTREVMQERALSKCTNVHLDGAKPCTLTHIRNSPKELTDSDGAIGDVRPHQPKNTSASVTAERVNGLVRGSLRRSPSFYRAPPTVATATADASQRLAAQIDSLGETMRAMLTAAVDEAMRQAAVVEEQKRQGAGLPYLIDRVQSVASWRPRNGSVVHDA